MKFRAWEQQTRDFMESGKGNNNACDSLGFCFISFLVELAIWNVTIENRKVRNTWQF
jgi:hypothetical protein